MPRPQRKQQIEELQVLRDGTKVVVYVTGDRAPNMATQIAGDVFPLMYTLLAKMGHVPKVNLFIYSTGGVTMVAWGLLNLLREFADSVSVLVPFRALSTATLIALGANEIIMSRLAQLSPVDPSVNTPFNPPVPQVPGGPPQGYLPVSVEDVRGFLDLAKDESGAGLKPDAMAGVFSDLARDVRPLALGNVHRAKEQIKMLTKQLLELHIPENDARVAPIVETFTRKLFSHDYLIGRREARNIIGNEVVDAVPALEKAMIDLYLSYAEDLELDKPYNAEGTLGKDNQKVATFRRAYIESTDGCYVFKTVRELHRVQVQSKPQVFGIQERLIEEGWASEDS